MLFLLNVGAGAWAGDPLPKLARDFGKSMSALKKPKVGILNFLYHDGKISSGSSILSERMTTYLADVKGIRVIERSLLKKVLEEQHLAETGLMDASAAQRIGKILDVDVVVTGTLNDLEGEQTELNARMLRSDTGEVLAARRVVVDRVWSDPPHRPRSRDDAANLSPSDDVKPAANDAIEIGFPGGDGRSGMGRMGRR
jgi:TolB-like protein